ncbi:hypothetical protein HDU97_008404 [Phlyctochytrium planicorne]|nr:hypothetical protein HDU97_008404 [Phlyctochytrium planicorne]
MADTKDSKEVLPPSYLLVDMPITSAPASSSSSSSTSTTPAQPTPTSTSASANTTIPIHDSLKPSPLPPIPSDQYTDLPPPSFSNAVEGIDVETGESDALLALPPDYLQGSLIPQRSYTYHYEQNQAPSGAVVTRNSKGVLSDDEMLQANPEELYRFFMTHMEPPTISVKVVGSHDETTTTYSTHTDKDGNTHTTSHTQTHEVEDFSIEVDCGSLIATDFVVLALDERLQYNEEDPNLFRTVLEEFTRSQNVLKEIHLEKVVAWQYGELEVALTNAVRQTGFRDRVKVTFPKKNYKVSVYSNSEWSKYARSWWTWVFLGITCLWVLVLPVFLLIRKRVKGRLRAEYDFCYTAEQFYNANVMVVMQAANGRARKVKVNATI